MRLSLLLLLLIICAVALAERRPAHSPFIPLRDNIASILRQWLSSSSSSSSSSDILHAPVESTDNNDNFEGVDQFPSLTDSAIERRINREETQQKEFERYH
ncbi:hypothetical protein PRIPAC_96549 [Pristionchus pacificus]|uniref:Uncharacterized protein n=1 Tax=Pristionchus pacificus TaxID=54126 RepID=A0A2A6BBY4_PRIPA|nr:hypothetical protein PRIPAC_96549 [Pristionchus pacificus]|eukprot:PDM63402.1 hypothetical protein PRIPAC_53759 [Pristionchus pacificus]